MPALRRAQDAEDALAGALLRNERLESELRRSSSKLEEMDVQVEALTRASSASDRSAKTTPDELTQLKRKLHTAEEEVAFLKGELKSRVAAAEAEAARLHQRIKDLEVWGPSLECGVVTDVQAALAQRDAKIQELTAMTESLGNRLSPSKVEAASRHREQEYEAARAAAERRIAVRAVDSCSV